MKLACQEEMIPGASLEEKADNLARWGYAGIEFWGAGLRERMAEIKRILRGPVRVSTICAGYRGCPLEADKRERDLALADARDLLSLGADLGGAGLIFVPIFGSPRLPDLSPLADAVSLEKGLLCKLLEELGDHAQKVGNDILLEPLNRYETHLLNRLEQAVEICRKVATPRLKIMADFFHMSIEEADIAASIRAAGDWIAHVHLADSNRLLPGKGHTDFAAGLKALKAIGYDKYLAMECGLGGDPRVELKKSADWLRQWM